MSNHICKRYIERILNIYKPVDILKYLKTHQYEINMELFKLLRSSQFLYEGNFDNPSYTRKSFFLKDNVLLIFSSNNIGVTLYKADSQRDFKINNIVMQIETLKNKIDKLENEKINLINELNKNKNIKLFLEGELLKNGGEVKNFISQKINKQNDTLNELDEQISNIKVKINSTKKQYEEEVKKIVFGKWIRIDQQCLITDEIEDEC
jgi:hypothetical protein